MKNSDAKRLMRIGKSKVFPIIDKTAYIRDGWAMATDLETILSVRTDIKGEGVIDLNTFSKIKAYDSAEIVDGFLVIKKGSGLSKFPLAGPIADYPNKKPICEKEIGGFTQENINTIKDMARFAGNDETRPVMNCVYLSEKNMVSTDAHKLRWVKNESNVSGILIPANLTGYLFDGLVYINAEEDRIKVIGKDQTLIIRLVVGIYPDYEAVIPKDNPVCLDVNTKNFLAAIENALPSANKSTNKIQLVAEAAKLTVSAEDLDFNREYSEEIPASLTGAQMFPIGFNGKFMQMVLDKSIETTVIEMSMPNRAAIVNGNSLLMPVMLGNNLQPVFGVKIGKGNDTAAEKLLENLLRLYRITERDMSFHISQTMAGNAHKSARQNLVEYITGETLPKAQCGITKIEELCKARFDEMIAAETPAETVEESPIQPETKTGKISPEPVEPEEAEVIENEPEAEAEPEPETETETEDLPNLITIVENITEKAFAVVGFTELLPEEFLNKYGSKCKILVGDERVSGYMFSKKRREALNEAIAAVGITYQTA